MLSIRPSLQLPFALGAISLFLLPLVVSPSPIFGQEVERITRENRRHIEGDEVLLMGGWGPHLRSILSSPGGDVWFVHDAGHDVLNNAGLRYRRRIDGQWIAAGSIDFVPPLKIQQNLAHVLIGTVIHSYGVDRPRRRLVECTFNTLSAGTASCADVEVNGQPLKLEANTNYIGAALSPDGYPVVWWSKTRLPGEASGKLFHLWRFSDRWNGPVETPVRIGEQTYANLAYARPAFAGRNRLELLGELEEGELHRTVQVTIRIAPDYPTAELSLVGPAERTFAAEDLWVDRRGGLHAITAAISPANSGFYFYRAPGEAWRFVQALPGLTVARFQESSFDAVLYLLADESGRLVLRSRSIDGHSGPLDFDGFAHRVVPWPFTPALSQPNAIYSMSRAYQTRDVHGLHFGLVGDSPAADDQVFYLHGPLVTLEAIASSPAAATAAE
ncbi:MAG: hypothetical protein AAGM22_23040 [Acidobacteriota bacterium]